MALRPFKWPNRQIIIIDLMFYVLSFIVIVTGVLVCVLQAVWIVFRELDLEPHSKCAWDSVALYDGSSDNSESLDRFCATGLSDISDSVQSVSTKSSGSSMFVVFQTDRSNNEGRFYLSWTFIPGQYRT